MRTVKIIIRKELNTAFNSWSTYIGFLLFFCICGFISWLSSSNIFYLGQASMMPFFIIVSILLGAIYPAIDVTAGEKERGTLETLLTLPVTNFEMIMSKFLAVSVIACVSAMLNVFSIRITPFLFSAMIV